MTSEEGTHEMTQHRWKGSLPTPGVPPSLRRGAYWLAAALTSNSPEWRRDYADLAAAHIRGVRKQIEAERGITSDRVIDWSEPNVTDEGLMWIALAYLGAAGTWQGDHAFVVDRLRRAEAALRTLWRRGQA